MDEATIKALSRVTVPSTHGMDEASRLAGVTTMIADLERMAKEDGNIAAAWVMEMLDSLTIMHDAVQDATCDALDDIAALSGIAEWEYPGQVVRDVFIVIAKARNAGRDGVPLEDVFGPAMDGRKLSRGMLEYGQAVVAREEGEALNR